ncbi:MAG: hypothetical protein H0V81_15845 [Solirubrobacterales bacterium]|nr:hypothetical protein [Solirubrobacterales bacterium]
MSHVRTLRRAIVRRLPSAPPPAATAPATGPLETDRATYLAAATLTDRLAATTAPPRPLARAELRVSSQNGEDGVLAEILRRLGPSPEPSFVEFGVETGTEGVCVFLADVLGWRGAFLEAEPALHALLTRKYALRPEVRTHRATVTPENVEALFAELEVPAEPDVLAIDIDGADYWVWRALGAYRPRVVVIEYNAGLGAERPLTVPADVAGWAGTDYFGASLPALERLGAAKGYRLVHTELAGVNAFFVRDDLAGAFPEPVLRRGPNILLRGVWHVPDTSGRPYLVDPPT